MDNHRQSLTQETFVTKSVTEFGVRLLQKGINPVQNGIVSAYSVISVLAMTLMGAKGKTAEEIKAVINPSTTSHGVNHSVNNNMEVDSAEDEMDGSRPSTQMYDTATDMLSTRPESYGTHQKSSRFKKVKQIIKRNNKDKLPFVIVDESFHRALAKTMDHTVCTTSQTEPAYILKNANKLYIRKSGSVSKDYIIATENVYSTKPEVMNFSSNPEKCRHEINHWVEKQTESKIKDLIPQGCIDGNTSIVIANAIYFKGSWANAFEPELTRQKVFRTPNGEHVQTDFMFKNDCFYHKIDSSRGCQVLEIPYINNDLSFFVVLPDEGTDFANLLNSLDAPSMTDLTTNLVERQIVVYLPKFKVELALELSSVLQTMGIKELFIPGKANLTGIDPKGSVYVSGLLHKAFIEVNEYGSEAAAATAEIVRAAGGTPQKRTIFNADHPFIFMIKDNRTENVLFLGQFCQPNMAN